MINNMNINRKLLLTYLMLVFTVIFVSIIAFYFLSQRYIVSEAKQQLIEESQSISQVLKGATLTNQNIAQKLASRNQLRIAGKYMDSTLIIMNAQKKILYSNLDRSELRKLQNASKNSRQYIMVEKPLVNKKGSDVGTVTLVAKLEDIKKLNGLMLRTQLLSMVIAGVLALTVATIFGRSMTKPIRLLARNMQSFSPKKEFKPLPIRTGDEIEELATSFSLMATNLQMADQQQKFFFQNASHELKTPLMSIQGNAEAIKDGILSKSEEQEGLDVIIHECQRLKSIVDEMIYLTKLENSNESYQFQELQIVKILHEAVKNTSGFANQKGVRVKIESRSEYIGLYDKEKLLRAFINVLSNSIRYAKREIHIQLAAKANEEIEILCKDDGKGFKNGEEKKVFERFYKGEDGGTGIGLAITKSIIEGHGGRINAHHNNPTGAVIKIILPYKGETKL